MNIKSIAYRAGLALALAAALGAFGAFAVRASAEDVSASVSVSIDANGQTGSLTLAQGQNLVLSWSSQSAAFCSIGAPINSQVPTQGSDVFPANHSFYPQSGAVTYTVTCDDGFGVTASDSVTVSPFEAPVQATVDITANASQGPVVLNPDQSFTVDWISANVVSCGLAIQGVTDLGGVALNGTSQVITPAHPFYPPAGGSHTFVITCADILQGTVTDSVTVMRAATPAPQAPVITATTGAQCGGTIDLAWNAVPNAASYKVFRGTTQVATVTGTTYSDSGLTPDQSFAYTVRASNSAGDSAPSNSATATASAACAPTTPTVDITANASQGPVVLNPDQSFTVDWISANVVSCGLAIQGVTDLGGVALNGTTGVIVPQSPLYPAAGGSHTFVITCTGIAGETITDSVVVSRPTLPPAAPSVTAVTSTQCGGYVDVSWNAVSGATLYRVFRDGVLATSTTATRFSDSGLTPQTFYVYTVKAVNGAGESAFSNPASARASSACVTKPEAPVLTATTGAQCGGTIALSWNAVPQATEYTIQRGSTVVATVTGTSFTDSGLQAGVSYTYSVTASNSAGDSAPSNSATATASAACTTPPQTPLLTATTGAQCGGTIDLAWNAVSGSSYYIVFRGDAQIATTSATTFTDTGLKKDTEFRYRVKAVNAEGTSAFSNKASAVSSGECTPAPSVVLEAVPSTINQGQTSTLSWISNNSVSCSAPWTTSTATSGSELVGPRVTTTYSITCTGPGGSSSATATVTVIPVNECSVPVITSPLSASGTIGTAFAYSATATVSGTTTAPMITITGTLPAGLSVSGATISGTPSEAGTFSVVIAASNACGTDTETLVITIGNGGGGGGGSISVTLTAQPTTIVRGATSTLSWISSNATECSAAWTAATSTAGSILVSPATTTAYAITCTNGSRSASATATVTVIDSPQCVAPNITSSLAVSAKVGVDFSYTITAENQSTSTLAFSVATSSLPAGLSLSGATITGTPVEAGTYTIQVTAANACGTDTENLVITVAPRDTVPPGGGGGGGSSRPPSGRRNTPASAGEVLGVTSCNYLEDFLRIDWQNDTIEVLKLQIFLKEMEGFTDLPITGVFDQKTFDAVAIFQERYKDDILTPWGHTRHTGFVYILTKKKVNEIVCQREFPLTGLEEQEIIDFRSFLSSLEAHGVSASTGSVAGAQDDKGQNKGQEIGKAADGQKGQEMSDSCQLYRTMCADEMGILNENGLDFASSEDPNQYGEIASGVSDTNTDARAIAAAIFSGPQGWKESWNALFGFFVILAAVYVASRAVTEKQHSRRPMNEQSRRARHLLWFTVGLLAAVGLCLIIGFYSIILPLLVLMILVAGMAIYALAAKKEERALIELR